MRPIYKCRICGVFTEEPVHCGREALLFLDSKRRVMLSRLMSGLLRHFPWEASLKLDGEGWVKIDELVKGIREKWRNREQYQWVTREHVIAIALLDPKGRFEVKDDMIRARYGHSIEVKVNYVEDKEVKILYHGTRADNIPNILREGLKPMKRLWVHLSPTPYDAYEVGKRHGGETVVLEIDVECLRKQGHRVYRAGKTVYVTDYVPPKCIKSKISV